MSNIPQGWDDEGNEQAMNFDEFMDYFTNKKEEE